MLLCSIFSFLCSTLLFRLLITPLISSNLFWTCSFLTPISQILFNIYLVTFLLQSPSEISLWNGHVLYLYVIIVDIRVSVSLCPNWRYAVTGSVLIVMVCWTYTTYAMSGYHHWCCEFESRSGRGVQHYVIKFVSDLRQVGGFLRFPPPIELTATI
jgi:hypothetical protein